MAAMVSLSLFMSCLLEGSLAKEQGRSQLVIQSPFRRPRSGSDLRNCTGILINNS